MINDSNKIKEFSLLTNLKQIPDLNFDGSFQQLTDFKTCYKRHILADKV